MRRTVRASTRDRLRSARRRDSTDKARNTIEGMCLPAPVVVGQYIFLAPTHAIRMDIGWQYFVKDDWSICRSEGS